MADYAHASEPSRSIRKAKPHLSSRGFNPAARVSGSTAQERIMASSPDFKIYAASGRTNASRYRGCMKTPEEAAIVVAALGDGTTIRYAHGWIVWREGSEAQSAAEDYGYVAEVVHERIKDRLRRYREAHA